MFLSLNRIKLRVVSVLGLFAMALALPVAALGEQPSVQEAGPFPEHIYGVGKCIMGWKISVEQKFWDAFRDKHPLLEGECDASGSVALTALQKALLISRYPAVAGHVRLIIDGGLVGNV